MKVGKSNTKSKKKGERQMKKYIKNKCNENQVKENKCFNYNNGITLVALVVTIVVLLILAGVSINLVLGQNGLIARAKEVREKTEEAKVSENISFNEVTDYIKQTVGVSAFGITKDDYGKVVTNYNADGKTWEIFYADDSNVYLITKESCGEQTLDDKIEGYNGTVDFDGSEKFRKKFPAVQAGWLYKIYTPSKDGNGILNYSSSYVNMKAIEYLLDSNVWNEKYLDNTKADWAIGGTTLELLVASYNKYKNENIEVELLKDYGYEKTINGGLEKDEIYNHRFSYWLACPNNYDSSYISYVYFQQGMVSNGNYELPSGIRPVVCLKSNIKLKLNDDKISYLIE